MTATYDLSTNTLTELPQMEKPQDPSELIGNGADVYFLQARRLWREYNAHVASLRTINCHEDCRSLWKQGQVVTEGVDYEVGVRPKDYVTANQPKYMAFPISKSEEDWKRFKERLSWAQALDKCNQIVSEYITKKQ